MINILFISFEFPPLNRGGVHRPLALVKYLPAFGIRPIVVTLDKNSFSDTYDSYGYDETLGAGTLKDSTVIPVLAEKADKPKGIAAFLSIYFSIHGNETKYWKKNYNKRVEELVREYQPQAIFATVPPFSVLPLAAETARKFKLPLLLDFRDAWSQWRTVPYGSIWHYWKTLSLEKKYLLTADAIIATSQQTLDDFKRLHTEVPEDKFHYIPNGYDGNLEAWQPLDISKEHFLIGYVGSFYYNPEARVQMLKPWWRKRFHRILQYIPHKQDWLYRSPYFFFKTLQAFNAKFPELAHKINVQFAGKKQDWLAQMISEFGLENQVTMIGELSHQDSLLFQKKCDALFITSAKQYGSKDYSIAGKTFEYLQMQKPILAFVCEGAQKDILAKSGTSIICDPDDIDSAVTQLKGLLSGQAQLKPDCAFLEGLSRKTLTGQLATIIENLIQHA